MGRDIFCFQRVGSIQRLLQQGCITAGLLLIGACAPSPSSSPAPDPIPTAVVETVPPIPEAPRVDVESPADAARTLNALGLDVYKRFSNEAGNLCLSPISIGATLACILEGARGDTAQEIEAAMGLAPGHRIGMGYQRLLDDLKGRNSLLCQVNLANALVYQGNISLDPEFASRLDILYRSTTLSTDFVANPDGARREINAWVSDNTAGKIRNFLGSRDTKVDTRFLLTSALGLDAAWETVFPLNQTRNAAFLLQEGEAVVAPMMHQKSHVAASLGSRLLQVLRLPYAGKHLEMVLFLPGEETSLHTLESMLSPDQLETWLERCEVSEVNVYLPRFTVDSGYYLDKALKELGIDCAFEAGCADFKGIAQEHFCLERTKHACYLQVDERGARAAAATGSSVGTFSATPTFLGNRPFLYLVRDTNTGAILFVGRVMNPLE